MNANLEEQITAPDFLQLVKKADDLAEARASFFFFTQADSYLTCRLSEAIEGEKKVN